MEASSAAVQTDGAEGAEGQVATGDGQPGADGAAEGQETTPDPMQPVLDRMGEIGERVDGLVAQIGQMSDAATGEPGADGALQDGPAGAGAGVPDALQEQLEAVYGPEGAQQIVDGLSQRTQAQVAEALGPLAQELQAMQVDATGEKLEAEFPDLAAREDGQPNPAADALWAEAQKRASQFGNPALVLDYDFIKQVHLSRVASERAASETPAGTGQGQVELESGDGANPGGTQTSDVSPQDQIVAAGRRTGGNAFGL